MKNKKLRTILHFLLCASVLLCSLMGLASGTQAPAVTVPACLGTQTCPTSASLSLQALSPSSTSSISSPSTLSTWSSLSSMQAKWQTSRKPSPETAAPAAVSLPDTLIPGGMPFGVKFTTDGVLIVGFCEIDAASGKVSPAKEAGLKVGDVIKKLDDTPIVDAVSLTNAMDAKNGQPFEMTVQRHDLTLTFHVTPALSQSENKYKTGIWVRDSGAGIGTVTFIDPTSGLFAGLGHGICDAETGDLVPLHRGQVLDVTISGIHRGEPGTPGEIKGYFNAEKLGSVFGNNDCGIYGLFSELPKGAGTPIPVGTRADLKPGEAEILCSLDDDTVRHYKVTISGIHPEATSNKCFTVTVTDPALLEKTGGIVQGMSGSPIVQNGKLVGAVTHVLISDPTVGYGIFIENMLCHIPE